MNSINKSVGFFKSDDDLKPLVAKRMSFTLKWNNGDESNFECSIANGMHRMRHYLFEDINKAQEFLEWLKTDAQLSEKNKTTIAQKANITNTADSYPKKYKNLDDDKTHYRIRLTSGQSEEVLGMVEVKEESTATFGKREELKSEKDGDDPFNPSSKNIGDHNL